jgi:hypothetical protein
LKTTASAQGLPFCPFAVFVAEAGTSTKCGPDGDGVAVGEGLADDGLALGATGDEVAADCRG